MRYPVWRAHGRRKYCAPMRDQAISRIGELFDLGLWADWFAQLDREFVFLLGLPFVVAVIGLWAARREKDDGRDRD